VADTGPAKPAFEKVTLKAETLFDFNKATLRPAGMEALNDVAAKMQQYTHVELVGITGHADRIGNDKYNMKLSQKRADAVKNYLVSKGVDAKRLEAAGKGETEPVVDCKNVKGKEHRSNKKLVECLQPNRRVVVEIKMQKS
jgi:OOP family OmpA-OmpF porin